MGTSATRIGARFALGALAAGTLAALGPATAFAAKSHGKTSTTTDTTPPSVTISTPTSGSTVGSSPSVAGSASDNVTVASVQVSVDGGAYQVASGTTSWSDLLSGLSAGTHTVTAKATDGAGNSSTSSISVSVSSSTATPPTSTITVPRYDGAVVAGPYTLSGSSSDATYTVVKEQWAIDGAPVATSSSTVGLSYTWDTTNVVQGSHTITYTTWNSAGASSSVSRPITVGAATIKRIGVVLYNFQDQAPATTTQQLADWTFGPTRSVAGYYKEQSYGRLLLGGQYNAAGDVFGSYTVPYNAPTTTPCDFASYETSALQQAGAAGVNLNGYDVLILTAGVIPGCGGGNATATQDRVPWVSMPTVDDWINAAGHELGHSFGVWHHASSWTCSDSTGHVVQDGGTCTSSEYGDPYDIMGQGHVQHMNAYEKAQLGFFRAGNLATVTSAGTYTLAPLTAPSSGVQAIRIPRAYDAAGNPTDYYYLEFRQPSTYDTTGSNVTDYDGVLVREAPDWSQSTTASNLVDTTPGSMTWPGVHDNFDAPLTPGRWFQDATVGISVTTVSVGSAGATVQVSFGTPQCVRVAPSISLSPAAQTGAAGATLYYSIRVANNDSPACGASDLTVTASLPSGFTQSPASTTFSGLYPAGATTGLSVAVNSSNFAASGSYGFTETVINGSSGGSATASGTIGVS